MEKGIVYIMTNPCLKGWVKIGMTDRSVEERLKELNSYANIPLSFRCFATYEVENAKEIETKIHNVIDAIDISKHAIEARSNGKPRKREFFQMSPDEAYSYLLFVASQRQEAHNVKFFEPTEEEAQEQKIADKKLRISNNTFKSLGIAKEEEITFLPDNSIIVKVDDDKNSVEYQGTKYAISRLATKLLVETQGWSKTSKANGWLYFTKNSIVLNNLRKQPDDSE